MFDKNLKKEIANLNSEKNLMFTKIEFMQDNIETMKQKLPILETKLETLKDTKTLSEQDKETLADLSIKMAKLWGLLTEKTPLGKEKLTKTGKRYGGKLLI